MTALGLDEQHALLKLVVERLERCGIPYMVAGSVAANSYMAARATNDIDIVVEIKEADIDRMIAAFERDFYINSQEAVQDAIRRQYPFNAIYLATAAKVDLVPLKRDGFARTEFERRRMILVQGEQYWFVTPEDYIISKLRTYVGTRSDRQLHDLQSVLRTQSTKLDWEYLNMWTERFNLKEELDKVR